MPRETDSTRFVDAESGRRVQIGRHDESPTSAGESCGFGQTDSAGLVEVDSIAFEFGYVAFPRIVDVANHSVLITRHSVYKCDRNHGRVDRRLRDGCVVAGVSGFVSYQRQSFWWDRLDDPTRVEVGNDLFSSILGSFGLALLREQVSGEEYRPANEYEQRDRQQGEVHAFGVVFDVIRCNDLLAVSPVGIRSELSIDWRMVAL